MRRRGLDRVCTRAYVYNMQTQQTTRFTINIDPATLEALHELAARRDVPAGIIVRKAVRDLLREAGFSLPGVHAVNTRRRAKITRPEPVEVA